MDKKPEKLVPEVRFKGFTDDWEQRELGEVAKVTMGQSPSSKNYTDNPNDYVLVQGNADLKSNEISPRVWTKEVTKQVHKGEFIMTVRAPVGYLATANMDAVIGRGVAAIDGNKYLYYLLQTKLLDRTWEKLSSGSTFESISSNDIKNLEIKVTETEEEKLIAKLMDTVTYFVTLQQRKLKQLKQLKKAMLQQLLANQSFPKVRFNDFKDSWKDYRLGEVFDEFSVKSKKENEYKLLSSTTSGMESRSGRVSGHSNIGYKVIDNGDIVLSPQNLWLGNINLNNMGKGIVSPSYHTFKIVNANPIFVNFQLKTKKMLFEYKMVSVQGASVVRRNLDMDAFKKIVIKIPNEKEQIKIASLFSSISNIINNHQNKLTQLTTLKKYLLQKLFI